MLDAMTCFCPWCLLLAHKSSYIPHDDVIKWEHFPCYWPFVRGIHRSPVDSPHKGQWRGALMFSLICAWINRWVNNREAGDLRRHRAHYDVIVINGMFSHVVLWFSEVVGQLRRIFLICRRSCRSTTIYKRDRNVGNLPFQFDTSVQLRCLPAWSS